MNRYGGLLVDQEMSRLCIALCPTWGGFAVFDERLARKWDGGFGHGSGFLYPADVGRLMQTPCFRRGCHGSCYGETSISTAVFHAVRGYHN
jgi:hypothetical protein